MFDENFIQKYWEFAQFAQSSDEENGVILGRYICLIKLIFFLFSSSNFSPGILIYFQHLKFKNRFLSAINKRRNLVYFFVFNIFLHQYFCYILRSLILKITVRYIINIVHLFKSVWKYSISRVPCKIFMKKYWEISRFKLLKFLN